MLGRVLKVTAVFIAASFLLTACDPPMPPEVRAALAEQSYTCESGDTKLSAPAPIAAVAGDWQASVTSNCAGMSITPVAKPAADVELQVAGAADKSCVAYASVPFAVDAAVIAFSLTDVTNLNLSADAIEKIWAGTISAWNDPELVKLNPSFELPNTPITFGTELSSVDAKPLTDWLTRLAGHPVALVGGKAKSSAPAEGSVILTSYSTAANFSLPMAGITAIAGKDGVVPEVGSINSGASMYAAKNVNGIVALTFDSKAKPIAPQGVAVAPAPYQAVSVINLNLCGTDSLKTRAAARYILRQDSQGSLGLSTVVGIPENLRLIALDTVSKGLPEPVITATPST